MSTMRRYASFLLAFTALFSFGLGFLLPSNASAARGPASCYQGLLGFPHWYEYLDLDGECKVVGPTAAGDANKLDVTAVATRVIMAIIDILMRVAGIVAFAFIVVSGFRFVLSQGDPGKEKAARETAINAVIGLVITIFAITIVTFVGRQISS